MNRNTNDNDKVDKKALLVITDTKKALVVCNNVSVVREMTAREFFVSVDVNKIAKASSSLKEKALRLKLQYAAG